VGIPRVSVKTSLQNEPPNEGMMAGLPFDERCSEGRDQHRVESVDEIADRRARAEIVPECFDPPAKPQGAGDAKYGHRASLGPRWRSCQPAPLCTPKTFMCR